VVVVLGVVADAGRAGWVAPRPEGNCVCPSCAHREPHIVGQPCYQKKCPQCGTQMTRK
jgi:hypothetical protein